MTRKPSSQPLLEQLEANEAERLEWLRLLTGRLPWSDTISERIQSLLFKLNGVAKKHGGEWTGSEKLLAGFMGRGERSVRRYVSFAEDAGLLLVCRRPGRRSVYLIDWDAVMETAAQPAASRSIDWDEVRRQRRAQRHPRPLLDGVATNNTKGAEIDSGNSGNAEPPAVTPDTPQPDPGQKVRVPRTKSPHRNQGTKRTNATT